MVAWPGTLPQRPLADGYGERLRKMGVRFEPEAGAAIQRRRVTATVRPLQVRLRLTPAQVEVLDGFWETDTAAGTLPFDWVHPRTGAAATLRFIADEPPQVVPINRGQQYIASFAIEVMP